MTKSVAREEEKVLSSTATLHVGDCLTVLPTLAQWSCHCCITDPPYELEFMGKDWDGTGVAFDLATWRAVKRCVTPGGYLLAFGGTRTFHRIMCAIEDAGWELIDTLMWLHGQGFPKGQGQLKPAWEPIILARRPSAKITPLGIDECRVPLGDKAQPKGSGDRRNCTKYAQDEWTKTQMYNGGNTTPMSGRYPANVVHDGSEEVMEAFAVFGERPGAVSNGSKTEAGHCGTNTFAIHHREQKPGRGDTGTAAHFFYCAKASRRERGESNSHPTVKPLALMRWLVCLVCPPGGICLEPFAGSGTTGLACLYESRNAVLVEREPAYADIIRARLRGAKLGNRLVEAANVSRS